MTITDQQVAFFKHFGYLHVRQLLSSDETRIITSGFERTIAECGPAVPSPKNRWLVLGPIQHRPEMNALLDHPGIVDLCSKLLGEDFNYVCGDGNLLSGDTQWHPDGGWEELFSCKLTFYLDPLTRSSGALRVIPFSHLVGHPMRGMIMNRYNGPELATRVVIAQQECGIAGCDLPGAEALETNPGDIVIFNHNIFHAAFGGNDRRRMFTLNLTRHCSSAEEMERLREYVTHNSPGHFNLNIGGMYFNPIIETASPARLRHLEQCRVMHDEIFPQLKCIMSHQEQVEAMKHLLHPQEIQAPMIA